MPPEANHHETLSDSRARSRAAALVVTIYVAATIMGFTLDWFSVPLPWMIGPLLAVIPLTIALKPPAPPRWTRIVGQIIVGTAVGLYLKPDALQQVLQKFTPLLLAAMLTILASCLIATLLTRTGKVDRSTALFAALPGGPVEMARLAEASGGVGAKVALAQTIRIVMVILLFPPMAFFFGTAVQAGDIIAATALDVNLPGLALLLGMVTLSGAVLRRMNGPNPYFLGPLTVAGALTATGLDLSDMPSAVLATGQMLLGVSLGSMFRPDLFRGQSSFVAFVMWSTVLMVMSSIAIAITLSFAFGIRPLTALLATAPGSVAEMAITAQALQMDVSLVTAFHVGRIFIIMVTAPLVYRAVKALTAREPDARP